MSSRSSRVTKDERLDCRRVKTYKKNDYCQRNKNNDNGFHSSSGETRSVLRDAVTTSLRPGRRISTEILGVFTQSWSNKTEMSDWSLEILK